MRSAGWKWLKWRRRSVRHRGANCAHSEMLYNMAAAQSAAPSFGGHDDRSAEPDFPPHLHRGRNRVGCYSGRDQPEPCPGHASANRARTRRPLLPGRVSDRQRCGPDPCCRAQRARGRSGDRSAWPGAGPDRQSDRGGHGCSYGKPMRPGAITIPAMSAPSRSIPIFRAMRICAATAMGHGAS